MEELLHEGLLRGVEILQGGQRVRVTLRRRSLVSWLLLGACFRGIRLKVPREVCGKRSLDAKRL